MGFFFSSAVWLTRHVWNSLYGYTGKICEMMCLIGILSNLTATELVFPGQNGHLQAFHSNSKPRQIFIFWSIVGNRYSDGGMNEGMCCGSSLYLNMQISCCINWQRSVSSGSCLSYLPSDRCPAEHDAGLLSGLMALDRRQNWPCVAR